MTETEINYDEIHPGSVESPKSYRQAYDLWLHNRPRFDKLYSPITAGIRRRSKNKKTVGIFAHEVSLYPERGVPSDIAFDLKAAKDFTIRQGQAYTVCTGVHLVMDNFTYAIVKGRSGISSKMGIDVLAGVIDPSYRGEIKVVLSSPRMDSRVIMKRIEDGRIKKVYKEITEPTSFKKYDRIAQLIFVPHSNYYQPIFEFDKIPKSDRGHSGFGSTGLTTEYTK